MKALDHPNIVPCLDIAYETGTPIDSIEDLIFSLMLDSNNSYRLRGDWNDLDGIPLSRARSRWTAREQVGEFDGGRNQTICDTAVTRDGVST